MNSKNINLAILALVMVVNALSYGIIIPLLYPYAAQFGIDPFGLSLLFASFALAQFLATPVLGRLSDRFGRKWVLLGSLFGTSVSLALFAMATSLPLLFIARILDGITGGNISVAQAAIADSTEGKDRAKAFGMLGAAFGFGFLVGPALGGWLGNFGLSIPFWFASALSLIGTVLGIVLFKETLSPENRKVATNEPMIDLSGLYHALFLPTTGVVLMLSFLSTMALNVFFFGFQTFTVDVLKLSTGVVGTLFALFGVVNVGMQMFGVRYLLKAIPSKKKILVGLFILSGLVMIGVSFTRSLVPFTSVLILHMIAAAPQSALITALLSERTNEEDQGGLLGINQSYLSLGQVVGPLLGGWLAPRAGVPSVFVMAGVLFFISVVIGRWLFVRPVKADI